MSFKNTLVMALLLGLVALFIFQFEIPEEDRKEKAGFVLKQVPAKDLNRIELKGAKGSVTFSRVSSSDASEVAAWQLASAPDALLDNAAISALESALREFKSESVIDQEPFAKDLSVYGLKNPALTIEVAANKESTVISFGKMNDFLGKRYVEIASQGGDKKFVLADEVLFNAANKDPKDFREKNPIQFSDFSVSRLTVESTERKSRIVLEQEGGEWVLREPVVAPADDSAVAAFFRDIRGLKAAEYFDNVSDFTPYRIDTPQLKVEVAFSNSELKPLVLSLSDAPVSLEQPTKKSLYLSRGGSTVYKTVDGQILTLDRSTRELRQKKLFQFPIDEATRLRTSFEKNGASKEVTVERRDGAWYIGDMTGDSVFIRQLLGDLSELEAKDFPLPGGSDFGFAAPSANYAVTLKDSAGKENIRELVVGKRVVIPSGGNGFYAADKANLDMPFIIAEASFQRLIPQEDSLKAAQTTPAPLPVR